MHADHPCSPAGQGELTMPCQKTVFSFWTQATKSNQEVIKVPEHNGARNISSSVAQCPEVVTTSGQLLRDHQSIFPQPILSL